MQYKKILVPLDGSQFAECVLPHLATLTSNCSITDIELVSVIPRLELHYKAAMPLDSREEDQISRAEVKAAKDYLEGVARRLQSPVLKVTTKVLTGKPAESLASYIGASGSDLLVMATHGRSGPSRWVMGSVADRLLQISPIPVFIVRPSGACSETPSSKEI